jgi:hypothetical protein
MVEKAWDMANNPIMTGIKDIPLSRLMLLKVKRGYPVMLSIPIKEREMPRAPQSKPFEREFPEILEIMLNPKTASRKNSGALNFKASFAS